MARARLDPPGWARIRGLPYPTNHLDAELIPLPIKTGGLWILSYKTGAPLYAAASEPADLTPNPVFTREALQASTQLTTQHQRCQEIFAGTREALLGSLTPGLAMAITEVSSKLGTDWLTITDFQLSLRLSAFEAAPALQPRTMAGEREADYTNCGGANCFGHPRGLPSEETVCGPPLRAKRVIGRALESTLGTRFRLEPLGHQTSRCKRHPGHHTPRGLGHGPTNAQYDLWVVSLASKNARTTSLTERNNNPSHLVNRYLDTAADHKIRPRPSISLPFHPIVFSVCGMMQAAPPRSSLHGSRSWHGGRIISVFKRLNLCVLG